MLPQFTSESLNAIAPGWLAAAQAALVQGTVALAFVAGFWALFRRHLSHAFAHGLFLLVSVKTAAAFLFVAWPVAIAFSVPLPQNLVALIHPPEKLQPSAKMALTSQIQLLESMTTEPRAELVLVDAPAVIAALPFEQVAEPPVASAVAMESKPLRAETPISAVAWLMIAWAVGVFIFTACFLANHVRMTRRLHLSAITPDPAHQAFVNTLAVQMKMRRAPLLLETPAVATPAVIGLFRPKLLVPQGFFTAFSIDETRWALLHELAHLRRRDLCWLALERTVGLALFFHPALWAARRATRFFRELACDDLAQMQSGLSPRTCAETFLKLVIWSGRPEIGPNPIAPTLSLTNRYPAIQKRIMNMTDRNNIHRPTRLSRGSAIAIAAFSVLVSLPFSPTIVAQAPSTATEVELSATDDKKPAQASVTTGRPSLSGAEFAEIEQLSEHLNQTLPKLDSFKPIQVKDIPVNQAPHQGALIDFPNIINPPDIIQVEVLQALPGRPIAGERTVQPDGTIGLGFYGRLHVSGLDLDQIKTKVLIHLRQYLSDEALGLVERNKNGKWRAIEPAKSAKVIVDLAQNNSRFYYVTGAVKVPGRYPINGHETVLDAITIAKGLTDEADLKQINLIRPPHHNDPSSKYTIDWNKIIREGDPKSNLQIFPGDRLIVVKKTEKASAKAAQLEQIPEVMAAGKPEDKPRFTAIQSYQYRGRVVMPDGSPAAGARVGYSTAKGDFPLMQGGIITGSLRAGKTPITDNQGQFELHTDAPVLEWLAIGQHGSTRQPGQEAKDLNSLVLRLQPFGGIEGTIRINGKPNSDTTVSVHYFRNPLGQIDSGQITAVNVDGKYKFQGLIPGRAFLEFRIGQPGVFKPITRRQLVEINSGEVKSYELNLDLVDIQRRDLLGKIEIVLYPDTKLVAVNQTTFELRALPGNPLRIEKIDGSKEIESRAKYLETPEGILLNKILSEFPNVPRHRFPDLSFRLSDVPIGKYELRIITASYDGKPIGSASKIIEIPQGIGHERNQPLDLGVFRIDTKNTDGNSKPHVGSTDTSNQKKTLQTQSTLESPRKIGGKIVDSKGNPVSGAEIRFLYLEEEPVLIVDFKGLPAVFSNADGTFQVPSLPASYKLAILQITRPGFASEQVPFNREDPRYESFLNNRAAIEMTAGKTVKGKVIDLDGKPLAGARVFQSPELNFNDAHTAITGPSGEFSFDTINTEKPSNVFYAKKPGYGTATYKLTRTDTIPPEIILQMQKPRELKVVVTDEQGKPIANVAAELRIRDLINGEFRLSAHSNTEGKISITDVPSNKDLLLSMTREGYARYFEFIKGDDLAEQKIQLKKGVSASGVVRNSLNLQPLEKFSVTIEVQNDKSTIRRKGDSYDFYKGQFRLGASTYSPESFNLIITAEGFRPFRSATYKLSDGPVVLDVKLDPIPLADLPHYRGQILRPDGKPAGTVKIGLVTDNDFPRIEKGQIASTNLGRTMPVSDANGAFDFHAPEPVREMLVLHESGAIRLKLEPGMDPKNVKLQLQPYGKLTGSLKRNGKPDLQSRIYTIYQSQIPRFWFMFDQVQLKQDGTFIVENVIPGEISIKYELSNIVDNSRINSFDNYLVKPGETVTVDRDLKLADLPRRDLVGQVRFADGKIPGDLSRSRIMLIAPKGNPLRAEPGNYILNSEERQKYRNTAEGKALALALDEFQILAKEMTSDGKFRISGVSAGRFELRITPGDSNVHYGTSNKAIEIKPLKPGELNNPVDLGDFMVEQRP